MPYQIDKKVIEKTTKCEGDFICLKTGICPKNKCKPTGAFDGHLFVETKATIPCGYHIPFGGAHICKCPTRNELYKRHKI